MKLSDMDNKNSGDLNRKMKELLGWNINLEAIDSKKAGTMLENINRKLNSVRYSHRIHESQNDPNYMGMLVAKKVLQNYIAEAKACKTNDGKDILMDKKVKEGNKYTGELAKAKAAGKDEFEVDGKKHKVKESAVAERKDPDKHRKLKAEYEKLTGKKAPAGTSTQAMQIIVDKAKREKEKSPVKESAGAKAFEVTINYKDKSGKGIASKTVTIKNAKDKQHAKDICMEKHCKSLEGAKIAKVKELATESAKRLQARAVVESAVARRRLLEDELSQAQAMLAAKDMVDSMQDMIEDISKMLNEQLPPLVDTIRSVIDQAKADAFKASANDVLSTLLTNVQSSRETMDQAVRSLSGEDLGVETPNLPATSDDTVTGIEDMDIDDFGASDAATGGSLPLGREKRD